MPALVAASSATGRRGGTVKRDLAPALVNWCLSSSAEYAAFPGDDTPLHRWIAQFKGMISTCRAQLVGIWQYVTKSGDCTVLSAKTPTTLSYSVPPLTDHPNSLANALDRWSTFCFTSCVEAVRPERAQVYGSFDLAIGYLPCFSSSINSCIGTVSGTSGSLGTHLGG